MYCKFCNAELEEGVTLCPVCGKDTSETPAPEQTEKYTAEVLDETEFPAKPKRKTWKIVLAIILAVVGCLALIACLTYGILNSMGISLKPKENNVLYKDSYVLEDAKAAKNADVVIARMGDEELTNSELQVYYTLQIYDFVSYYGSILSYVGFDYTKPLSEQPCYFDETLTWQQYFVDVAIETWQHYTILNLLAKEINCQLPEESLAQIDAIPDELAQIAAEYELENVDAFMLEYYGASSSVDAYVSYIYTTTLGEVYYEQNSEKLMPTDKEIEDYYTANETYFKESGITKESGPMVDVRHILIAPQSDNKDESGNPVYSDADWEACYAKAESILAQWKSGEATEESFIALVKEHTEDTGSKETGGLYEGITSASSFVENFLKWSIDETRQKGDTGIVKSEYGYHIMYFVDGEPQWIAAARTNLLADRITALVDEASQRWPMEVNYKKISLSKNSIAS